MFVDNIDLLTRPGFEGRFRHISRNGLPYSETNSKGQRSTSATTTQLQALSREKIEM
jgi:hypothetical protein